MKKSPAMLALVTDAFGGRGGIAQYNRDFLSALAKTGALASIVVLPRSSPDIPKLPEGIEQRPARSGRLAYSIDALRASLGRSIEVVFCGHLFMAPLAALIARLKGAKFVIQTHGIEAWPRPTRLQRAALESADLVLCVSRHTRAAVLSWAAIQPERLLVVPNTVREVFQPGDGSASRAALGLGSQRVLVSVSRLDASQQYKGQDRVIAAIPALVAKGYDICYLIVGEGDDRPRLEALAREAGMNDRVRFLGGIGVQELVEAYRMADLFVLPSTGEGFGIVFLEAMASGTPALGLGVAGATDALADGRLGTMISAAELPTAIAQMLDAPRPDPKALAAAVLARFGRDTFAAVASAAVGRLSEGFELTSRRAS